MIRQLLKKHKPQPDRELQAPLRPEELVPDQVAEIRSPDFQGERLPVCLNPSLRSERARKREAPLRTAEEAPEGIERAMRRPSTGG